MQTQMQRMAEVHESYEAIIAFLAWAKDQGYYFVSDSHVCGPDGCEVVSSSLNDNEWLAMWYFGIDQYRYKQELETEKRKIKRKAVAV